MDSMPRRAIVAAAMLGAVAAWRPSAARAQVRDQIFAELNPYFEVVERSFFPIPIPLLTCNLVVGLTLKPRAVANRAAA